MAKFKMASNGQKFGAFFCANGDYIAAVDEQGFHRQPPSYQSLPSWDDAESQRQLDETVAEYEVTLRVSRGA